MQDRLASVSLPVTTFQDQNHDADTLQIRFGYGMAVTVEGSLGDFASRSQIAKMVRELRKTSTKVGITCLHSSHLVKKELPMINDASSMLSSTHELPQCQSCPFALHAQCSFYMSRPNHKIACQVILP